jgi:hypothetical protein
VSRQNHRFGDAQPNTDAAFEISRNSPALVVVQTLGAIIGPLVATRRHVLVYCISSEQILKQTLAHCLLKTGSVSDDIRFASGCDTSSSVRLLVAV